MRPSDPRLRRWLAPARCQLGIVVAAGVVGSVLLVAQAWAVTGLIVAVVRHEVLGPAMGWVAALFALRAAVSWCGDAAAAGAAAGVGTSLRRELIASTLTSGGTERAGDVTALATHGVAAAEPYLTRYLPAVVLAVVLPPLTVVAIATQDLLNALIVVLTLPLVPLFGAIVGLATRDRAREQWQELASLSGHFNDVVRGLPTLVAFRRARAQSSRIATITDRCRLASMRTLRIAFASSAVLELVATLSVALVAVTVGVRLASGSIGLHTALVVLLLAPEAYWPLRRMGAEFHAAAEGAATFEQVDSRVGPSSLTSPAPSGPWDGALRVRDLTYCYPGRTSRALDGLDLTLSPRGVTVLTGPSGCGKSTLLSILAGLATPDAGSARVGDRTAAGEAWRSQVSWLPQRPQFVAGSIADNLRLARPGATEAELWSALRSVALEERVRTLPDGLDDGLGEDGATLSAGERARLALARVVVADRPWVLLDEPTAHVDELTERIIADTIVDLGRRAGVVVVAHRPALVALADHHVVLPAPHRPRVEAAETSATGPLRRGTATPAYVPDSPARGTVRRQLAVGAVLGALASASGVALTATAGWLIVQASTRPPVLTLLVAIVGVRTFGLARPALRYVERLTSHDAALRLLAARRVQVYESIVPLTPGRLGRRRGDVLASIVDDVDAVVDAELRVRMPARTATLVSSCGIAVATLVLPQAGIVLAAYCVVAGLGSWTIARIGAARAERSYVDRRAALSEIVHDAIQVREELLMWQAVDATCDSVSAASAALGRSGTSAARWSATARAWISATTGVAVAAMAWAALGGLDGGISAPMAALLVLVPLGLSEVIAPLPDAATLSVRTRASAARLAGLEHATPAVREIPATAHPRGTALDVERVRGRWHDAAPVTSEVSFMAAPGERIGIVGASGSGKSTVAALLLRFLDPVAGTISLGGATTTRMGLDEVRALTGLVDDDPHVFATTLLENVRLARPGADARAVESALGRAGLGTWLDSLPSGLDTWLGDGHGGLSGGERARLGLARCLLADQPVLVLDEPTAHLDHTTARALAEHVLRGERRTTVIWITHDPVGLELVDRVVDLGPHPSYVSSARRDDPADRR